MENGKLRNIPITCNLYPAPLLQLHRPHLPVGFAVFNH